MQSNFLGLVSWRDREVRPDERLHDDRSFHSWSRGSGRRLGLGECSGHTLGTISRRSTNRGGDGSEGRFGPFSEGVVEQAVPGRCHTGALDVEGLLTPSGRLSLGRLQHS